MKPIYGNTPDVLSQLIRTMLVEGWLQFIVADFSAINEARVLAQEAGEEWRLDAFRKDKTSTVHPRHQMFHVPVVKHSVNGELSQKGGGQARLYCAGKAALY